MNRLGLGIAITSIVATLACGGADRTVKRSQSRSGGKVVGKAGGAKVRKGSSAASARCARLLPLIRKAAREANVETALLVGVIRTESNFRNDVTSSAGAVGLTQCMKATARAKKCGDLSDPYQNLKCGARVLSAFLKYYKGDLILGLSGYNAGHGMPDAARKGRELPANTGYVEHVLWARSRFLYRGCDF